VKITFLCPHVRIAGGVRAILTYADRLAARGHDVTLVVPAKSRVRAAWRNVRGVGPDWVPELRARVRWVGRWTPEALAQGDVVQHYESLYHGAPDAVDTTYRLPLKKVVISTWLRDLMRQRFGSPAEVLVTPVDLDLFHPTPADVSTSRPRVLMLHHEHAWKGVADGFEAVARVTRHVPTLRLVGFGVKPPRDAVPYDEFHLNPPQDRLAAVYSSCEIYLCPSWDEGLGMPPMEAMACGAAVVTYDNGGCRDYARDGETALVARRRDIGDLAAKLERLVVDESLRARLAAAGMRFVTTAFSWDRAVRRLEEIFG